MQDVDRERAPTEPGQHPGRASLGQPHAQPDAERHADHAGNQHHADARHPEQRQDDDQRQVGQPQAPRDPRGRAGPAAYQVGGQGTDGEEGEVEDHRHPVPVVGRQQPGEGRHNRAGRQHREDREAREQPGQGEVDRERVEEPQPGRGPHEVGHQLAEVLGPVHGEQSLHREERALQDQPDDVEVVRREHPTPGLRPRPAHGAGGDQSAEHEEERHPHRLERHRDPVPGIGHRGQRRRGLQREVLHDRVVQHHQQDAHALRDVDPQHPTTGTTLGARVDGRVGGREGHAARVRSTSPQDRTGDDVSLVTDARGARSPRSCPAG